MNDKRFEGQVALVTGGARGIGFAIGKRLAREGATTIVADIDGHALDSVGAVVRNPERIVPMILDITDSDACRNLVAWIADEHARLDILVNNAAILDICPYPDLTIERFRAITQVNLDGALICSLACVPLMESTGGRILMTASIMGQFGSPDSLPYSTAKGGIVNMVRALACDLAPKRITVNGIAPGFIDTRMARLADGSHEHETEYFRTVYLQYGKIPLGRPGQPEDVAGAACFLVSPDAAYITGQILAVDGGVTATF